MQPPSLGFQPCEAAIGRQLSVAVAYFGQHARSESSHQFLRYHVLRWSQPVNHGRKADQRPLLNQNAHCFVKRA